MLKVTRTSDTETDRLVQRWCDKLTQGKKRIMFCINCPVEHRISNLFKLFCKVEVFPPVTALNHAIFLREGVFTNICC